MYVSSFFRLLLFLMLVMVCPVFVQAGVPVNSLSFVPQEQKKKKQEVRKQDTRKSDKKEKPPQKVEVKKTDIKEVPKARKQSRPAVVAKPKVKVKPVKIVRPKIRKP